MSRLGRVGRRPDHWASPHERARVRAAERLDAPLSESESAWLDDHLASCPSCLATADAYEADRLALRSLASTMPEPPRDLWARTAAGIEQEAAGRRRLERTASRRPAIAQFGAIAGIAVVAVVVGSSVLSGAWLDGPIGTTNGPDVTDGTGGSVAVVPTAPPTGIVVVPGATPIAVDAGDVGWFDVGADGSYAYNVADIDEVCAEVDQASCAALADDQGERVVLAAAPKSIISSPANGQTVVVGDDEATGNQVFVLALPGHETPAASPTPTASADPTPTTTPETSPSTAPTDSPAPPSDAPSGDPSVEPSIAPTLTPAPTAAALAIVSGVTVVGDGAAFSPDGAWFAFTARPADGSSGPDIYVWRVGADRAEPVTGDHVSEFASWAGGLVVGSRPEGPAVTASPDPSASPDAQASADPSASPDASAGGRTEAVAPVLFTIDPATGAEAPLAMAAWRPSVDPTGARAVAWDGTVAATADGTSIEPAEGRLVLTSWGGGAADIDPDAVAVSESPLSDFTVRWDETGTWLAVWVADPADPAIGRLSLLHIDPATGAVDRPKAGPQDVPALPGFSIEDGRLAWATPPSQDGEGSRVQIVAWSADGVGSIESAPGQDVVVVR